jgi:hypothetical protein
MTRSIIVALAFPTLLSATALAAEPGAHPYSHWTGEVRTISWAEIEAGRTLATPVEQRDFAMLDAVAAGDIEADPDGKSPRADLPAGLVQRGGVVLPQAIEDGTVVIEPEDIFAVEDIPGNEYPRKHTLFINFNGGMLYAGADNSAENRSTLAKQGIYPTYEGTEQKALSIIQAVTDDVAAYGISVVYLQRPNNTVPYTMEMVGGEWTDTNIGSAAGGVAPGADCGALGQRHVVYTFASGGTSATQAANTASQEAGHAWGLDHTFNCSSVMSYCGVADGSFSSACDGLCEAQCQGPNSAGCRLTHEEYCGEGNDQQNEDAELTWLFGGNEPDMEPPTVEIVEPMDGVEIEAGGDVDLRTLIDDDYGGYGWYYVVTRDGEEIANFVDYDRQVDEMFRPALNLGGLDAGEWVFTVGAEDHFGHITEDSVTVFVGVANETGTVDSSSGGDAMTSGPMGTGGDSESGGSESGDFPDIEDGGETGCACRAATSHGGSGWAGSWLLLGAWAWRRRRRR